MGNQVERCRAVRGRNFYASPAGLKHDIRNQLKSKLIYVELQAFLHVVDEDIKRLNAEIKVPLVLILREFDTGRRQWVHRRDYKSAQEFQADATLTEIM